MADEKNTKNAAKEVASAEENAKLEHSQGGSTTRDDAADMGVPMLPGDPSEPVGPEDALGEGPTRGDYRDRIGPSGYNPHEVVQNPDYDPSEPTGPDNQPVLVKAQRAHAESIGDEKGKKGGVETA